MGYSPLLSRLMEALRCLPGVGPKSSQRMALYLLERERQGAERLVVALQEALARVGHCRRCRTLSEQELCEICSSNTRRQSGQLCIVETPADVFAVEQATDYQGQYFVLQGHLSPLDGIGPAELGLDCLETLLDDAAIQEVILATNPTVEGDATAYYVADLARQRGLRVTRIAHGVPLGGEL